MGPARTITDRPPPWRRRVPRSRLPLHRRLVRDRAAVRRWVVVAVLAWGLATVVTRAVDGADAAQRRWGRTVPVWVADRPIRAGEPLASAVRRERWPAALVPSASIRRVPGSHRAATAVDAGSVLTEAMVEAPEAAGRTIAVPLPDARLPVEEGQRVDVWATADPTLAEDRQAAARRIAVGARVMSRTDRAVVLEVAPAQVAAVAEAAATATITLVGVP